MAIFITRLLFLFCLIFFRLIDFSWTLRLVIYFLLFFFYFTRNFRLRLDDSPSSTSWSIRIWWRISITLVDHPVCEECLSRYFSGWLFRLSRLWVIHRMLWCSSISGCLSRLDPSCSSSCPVQSWLRAIRAVHLRLFKLLSFQPHHF